MILFKKVLLRGAIPFIIMTGISFLMKAQNLDSFQVRSTFVTGLIITAVAAASVIYDIKHWSLLKQSVVHFIIMLGTVLPCLLLSGWFPVGEAQDILKIVVIFLVTGIVLWLLAYFIIVKFFNAS
ncbi:DUF3021 family protein [Carnobacterium mobile]|uniref:DUF3021 family protein n=1 Tax=Carnobacterium mobile TaxID=2750 RepID=UPI001B8054C2|nr:DUF3021 family protein [Carnobacterium mobile]